MTVRFSPRTRALRLPLIVLGLGLSGAARAQPVTPPAPQLPAVTVPGAAVQETATGPVRGFVAERAVTATKTDAPVMETPQSISVITRDRMELQGAQSVQQATGYSAGVTANNRIDHRRDGVKIRGADSTHYLDGLLNSAWYYNNTRPDPYALERIEILRGPSGMLYGQGSIGGILNLVSKRPQAEAMRELGVSYGSHDRKQVQADFTGPLDAGGSWLYRIVALGRDSDSAVKHAKDNRYFVAPSLTWRPSAATSLTLLGNLQEDDSGTMAGFFPRRGTVTDTPAGRIPQDFFVSEPDFDKYVARQRAAGYQFEHAFNDRLTVRQNLRYTQSAVDYRSIYTAGFTGASHGWVPGSDTLLRRKLYQEQKALRQGVADTQAQLSLRAGPVRHTVLAGIDYQRAILDSRLGLGGTAAPIDVHHPVYGNYVAPTSYAWSTYRAHQTGLYLQDQLEWERWLLMLGLRHDHSRTSVDNDPKGGADDSALTRRFGLMYRSVAGLNPYISYAESFEGQTGLNKANEPFKPLRGKQWEAGAKYQPAGRNLTLTAAIFAMIENNRKVPGVVNGRADTVQVGQARTRGLELEALASQGNLDLVASYTYLDARVARGKPAEEGRQLSGIARHMASFWANYRFRAFGVSGLVAGAGARYNGTHDDGTGHNGMAAVTLYDAVLAYDAGPMRMALNVTNLFDKRYVDVCLARGDCFFGTRRSVVGSVTYRF
ncbi:TonB-dependent siderophore receptor [Achromobacter xylosoxidans]|uniref:TonB-dependent siderophore receptor n=1 Tax=Alcaligenes xylosoxydans xylosoxydans TaxID=85698 RepID=UPI002ACA9121|nr:TonB-dependent siderophore receptor [Achromobacter xylosoxidans]MDZ5614632.1 TonB-dependent siderophore receptor [Achromobacter xylosoxidans]MDZ5625377.1 TonB-dependent siderophore receptor [Achromobacter xylosoxidans]MDZ5685628.1 TonB-dependent siderophore receptor [Achromobacter xylosoxidans]